MSIVSKPLISLILPVFNEDEILEKNLEILYSATQDLKQYYYWEIIAVDDGSVDHSGEILEEFSEKYPNVRVYHHKKNLGLGKALQNGFALSKGDYVLTYDIDLTYSVDYIEILLQNIIESQVKMVMASPFMKGGEITHVPWFRKMLSTVANRFLSMFTEAKISCLTCMIRAYDGEFIRSLNLRSRGKEIMQEIVHKTLITRGEIIEIPAHLDWKEDGDRSKRPVSKRYLFKHISATFLRGFLIRPVVFFIIPGALLFLFSLYPNFWMLNHILTAFHSIDGGSFSDRWSQALELSYKEHPHTFHTGLLVLLVSIQLLALGFQSLQQKHAYEELFDLGTRLNRRMKK